MTYLTIDLFLYFRQFLKSSKDYYVIICTHTQKLTIRFSVEIPGSASIAPPILICLKCLTDCSTR